MLKRSRAARVAATVVALCIPVSLASTATASAESDSCWFSLIKFGTTECPVGPVKANPSGHFLYYEVSPNAHYALEDRTTGVVLRSGSASYLGKHETVFGLYGTNYWLTVKNSYLPGWGYLSNQ